MRRRFGWSALAAVCALSARASADDVHGTKSDQMSETGHTIEMKLHTGWAELVVRRTVHNAFDKHDQAMFMLDVPTGAVATGLRTLGSLKGQNHWFSGELMEAEAAAAKYRELTGIGGYYPKDPALLSWRSADLLALQVFPVAPHSDKTVEYTLSVPLEYREGAYRYSLPGLGTESLLAEVTLKRASRGGTLLVDGTKVSSGHVLRTKRGEVAEVALVPKTSTPIGGMLAAAEAGDHRFVTRFGVDIAPQISRTPDKAYIVIAIDASRSMSSSDIDAMKQAAAAYLSHFKDAKVEVLAFDRETHPRYGKFVDGATARRDFPAWNVKQRNGSAVEVALASAEKLLMKAPAGAARRIVLMTDGHARSGMKPDLLKAAVGASGAVTHIGIIAYAFPQLSRDDSHPWAEAARVTGGLVWNASASDDSQQLAEQKSVYEEWARPLRIDQVELFSPDFAIGGSAEPPPTTLNEGEGYARLFVGTRAVDWLRVEGELWSRPVQQVIHSEKAGNKRWAALVFGSSLLNDLSETEMSKLAMFGGAVSPVTSYLAIEPGVRPSTEGLEWGTGSGMGRGMSAPSVRMGATSTRGSVRPFDRNKWLKTALAAGFRACGGTGSASITLETTLVEVVDVTRVELETKDALLQRCLEGAVWDLALPVAFNDTWQSYSVEL